MDSDDSDGSSGDAPNDSSPILGGQRVSKGTRRDESRSDESE